MAEDNTCFDFLDTLALRFGYEQRDGRTKRHDSREQPQHTVEPNLLCDRAEGKCSQHRACLARSCSNAVGCTPDPGREDLNGYQERRRIRTQIQDELADREDRNQPASRDMVRDASPDGVEDADDDAGVELLTHTADEVGQEDCNVETWKVPGAGDDDVAYCRVPEGEEGGCAFAVADLREDEGLVEVDAVEGYVAFGEG